MAILAVKDISKSFGATRALDAISFEVMDGEIVALLGPSGCGKSTLLMLIAGLETPDEGEVLWNGSVLRDTPPHRREFGLMFQDFALFPHMNVYANVAFGLKMAHLDSEQIDHRVNQVLELVGLNDFVNRDVNTLSGGEQQRVALARALAPHPRLLMLDEPLGSLDRNLRERLVNELHDILKELHQTAIYVTHDQEEAFAIADRVILLNSGRLEQAGTPVEIYMHPASLFVARFLEMTNIIPGEIRTLDGTRQIITSLGNFPVDSSHEGLASLLIRPDQVRLDESGPHILRGIIMEVGFRGSMQKVTVAVNHVTLTFDLPSLLSLPAIATEVSISLDPKTAIQVFPIL